MGLVDQPVDLRIDGGQGLGKRAGDGQGGIQSRKTRLEETDREAGEK
jgi:hypothetical protein